MKTRFPDSVKRLSLLTFLSIIACTASSQQVYDTFESAGVVSYTTTKTAKLDTMATNPSMDEMNGSGNCAKFTRSRQRYDYLKLYPKGLISNVQSYASYEPSAPKIKMKVYSTAPVGTLVEIQLGKRSGVAYPDGTHSQYQARTTKKNAWEELEFKYVVSPKGSRTSAEEIDQVTVLFNPNSGTHDTYYFDDITGPEIVAKPVQKQARLWKRNK